MRACRSRHRSRHRTMTNQLRSASFHWRLPNPALLPGQRNSPQVHPTTGGESGKPQGATHHWPLLGDSQWRLGCGPPAQVIGSIGCSCLLIGLINPRAISPTPGSRFHALSTPPLSPFRRIGGKIAAKRMGTLPNDWQVGNSRGFAKCTQAGQFILPA